MRKPGVSIHRYESRAGAATSMHLHRRRGEAWDGEGRSGAGEFQGGIPAMVGNAGWVGWSWIRRGLIGREFNGEFFRSGPLLGRSGLIAVEDRFMEIN